MISGVMIESAPTASPYVAAPTGLWRKASGCPLGAGYLGFEVRWASNPNGVEAGRAATALRLRLPTTLLPKVGARANLGLEAGIPLGFFARRQEIEMRPAALNI